MDVSSLTCVDLVGDSGTPVEGLVSVAKPPANLPPSEMAFIERTAAIGKVDYVFFRRFDDGRSSQPLAFVVDNSDERLTKNELAKLHNDLWLNGGAPLIYVAWATQIDILSCARGPDFWQESERAYIPADLIDIASTVSTELGDKRSRYSAHRLANGTFWDDPKNQTLADHEKVAHEALIQAIVVTDKELNGEHNATLRRLLLLVVLIKYLEDRKVFPGPWWFGHFHKGARSFLDVLKCGDPETVLRLLGNLEAKFNGDVFSLPNESRLTRSSLRRFVSLVEARTLNSQLYLWEQYSFAHLPVEVISHLYQRFVTGSTAVYTPPFLAALLLDFAMPYETLRGAERVLDPACGSGVFLVGAFRRLVNLWRANNNWANPSVEVLKSILRNQMFGVELDAVAIDLTAFSLALAVCDSLQPNVIWNELRFDRLRGRNLFEDDFFNFLSLSDGNAVCSLGGFDIVIGNPPFESEFSAPAKRVNEKRSGDGVKIPDKQIAYLFLEQAFQVANDNGVICLIQPSGFLYNVKAANIRSRVFGEHQVTFVLDFASIRKLFDEADPKAIAIIARKRPSSAASSILHLTFRRTASVHERIAFELDHYDRHVLSQRQAMENDLIWKFNLLGGGRIGAVCDRFRDISKFASFVNRESEWRYSEGFNAGQKKPAEFLTGLPYLPENKLRDGTIELTTLEPLTDVYFEAPRKKELYNAPLMLIGETLDLPVGILMKGKVAFSKQIVGLSVPVTDSANLLAVFEAFLKRKLLYRFWIAVRSSRAMASMATSILKADIDSLPFSFDDDEFELCFWETVIAEDVLTHLSEFVRLGQNSRLLMESATNTDLRSFADVYCRMLGSIYENLRAAEPIFLDGLICQPFYFGEKPSIKWLDSECQGHISKLVYDKTVVSLQTTRVVRIYHENVIFIVKPDRLRYWIRSTAIRDADDTFVEMKKQGF